MDQQQTPLSSHAFPDFGNTAWDTMPKAKRDALITELTKSQVQFMKDQVPFYTKFYGSVDIHNLVDIKDCAMRIPALLKDQIRALPSPYELLPKIVRSQLGVISLHRGTGGTTGRPTSVFFTESDWNGIMSGNARQISKIAPKSKPFIAFNGYNQGHISGPYFDSVVRKLGALTISRNFGCSDDDAVKQMAYHQANLIIAPAVTTHKGGSFENLLDADARSGTNFINGDNVDTLLCSSTGITRDLYQEIKALGIKHVVNMYGSTDVGAVANSPPENPFELRIDFGHSATFVVDPKQNPVADGQRGLLISSRIGGLDADGNILPNLGTQLINFHLGDEVTFHDHASDPSITTPWISDVQRVMNIKEKIEGGCERW